MSFPEELSYTAEHEWVGLSGPDADIATVGITSYAADQLGDVVYVQAPDEATEVRAGEACGEVESTKSVSDIYSPVDGEVMEVNQAVVDDPALVNTDPYGEGWLFKVRVSEEPGDLLTAEEYAKLTQSG